MLELLQDRLTFSFPEVSEGAKMHIDLHRTLRIPDDGKEYPLPPSLGRFPIKQVDDFKDRAPHKWLAHGGVMTPIFQSEAMWLQFVGYDVPRRGRYPFAVKIAAGKVSALTGEEWKDGLQTKDYAVIPNQPWLDGYVVEKGLVRQFIAAPLGSGFSAEEQITGKAQYGGIQIEVYPMKREVFERRFPLKPERIGGNVLRSTGMSGLGPLSNYAPPGVYSQTLTKSAGGGQSAGGYYPASARPETKTSSYSTSDIVESSMDLGRSRGIELNEDMGLAAGGRMKQQVFEDPYDINDWDLTQRSRCFIHLANSLIWKAITKQDPPNPPLTAAHYSQSGMPWFDYYTDDWKSLDGTDKLQGLKSVLEMGLQKGVHILPENLSVDFKSDQVHVLGPQKRKEEVRAGSW